MVLFVCRANLNRSPRAAEVFRRLAKEAGLDIEVVSAGIDTNPSIRPEILREAYGVKETTQLTSGLLARADKIVALDRGVLGDMVDRFDVNPDGVVDLDIADRFSKRRGTLDELYRLLEKKLTPFLRDVSILLGAEGNVRKERE